MSQKTKPKTEILLDEPKMFSIVIYNDDFTTMNFVVGLLMKVFDKSEFDATYIMMKIHGEGKSIVASFIYDIAVTKKYEAEKMARENEFPLKISIEEVVL